MKPKAPGETAEQKAVRIRSEQDNVRSIQEGAAQRTNVFRRLKSPRVSLATGNSSSGAF